MGSVHGGLLNIRFKAGWKTLGENERNEGRTPHVYLLSDKGRHSDCERIHSLDVENA